MKDRELEIVGDALDKLNIEIPSWGFANTGTRFGKFIQAETDAAGHFNVPRNAVSAHDQTKNNRALIFGLTGFFRILRIGRVSSFGSANATADTKHTTADTTATAFTNAWAGTYDAFATAAHSQRIALVHSTLEKPGEVYLSDGVDKLPLLLVELARRGWTDDELAKVAGGNILRVMREAEAVAKRMQQTERPSSETIEVLDAPGTKKS